MGSISYNRDHVKQLKLALNLKTDTDIIEHLGTKGNVQGYIKELIRKNMEEEKTMASRIFYRGSEVGDIMVNEAVLGYTSDGDFTEEQINEMISAFRTKMRDAISNLDDRLWWQPETGEVFYKDTDPEKPLPDSDEFIDWWNETTGSILGSLC